MYIYPVEMITDVVNKIYNNKCIKEQNIQHLHEEPPMYYYGHKMISFSNNYNHY